jgi:glycerol-3-phosphate dehydrogenase
LRCHSKGLHEYEAIQSNSTLRSIFEGAIDRVRDRFGKEMERLHAFRVSLPSIDTRESFVKYWNRKNRNCSIGSEAPRHAAKHRELVGQPMQPHTGLLYGGSGRTAEAASI